MSTKPGQSQFDAHDRAFAFFKGACKAVQMDELARSFVQGREGMALSAAWDQRVEREAKETERQRARAEERERRGLPPEPQQDRERQSRGLGLGR